MVACYSNVIYVRIIVFISTAVLALAPATIMDEGRPHFIQATSVVEEVEEARVENIERTSNNTSVDYSTKVEVPEPVYPASGGVASTAMSMAGTPYSYGGKTPAGWDCSGFVSWVYAQNGMSIPSQTSAIRNSGNTVPVSDPRPGDLVFQGGGSHVGVYLGQGQMISARNPSAGTTVHPTSWNGGVSGYYRFVG